MLLQFVYSELLGIDTVLPHGDPRAAHTITAEQADHFQLLPDISDSARDNDQLALDDQLPVPDAGPQ